MKSRVNCIIFCNDYRKYLYDYKLNLSICYILKHSPFTASLYINENKTWGQSWRRGTECHCKRDRLWIRFPLEGDNYLIFSFLRSGVEAKRGVEFHHSIHSASSIRRKMKKGVSYIRFPLPMPFCAGHSVKLKRKGKNLTISWYN